MSDFWQRYKDPRWQKRRLEILKRSEFSCENCEATDKTLHVHHKLYRKDAMPWEYEDHELQALCQTCHEETTHFAARLKKAISELDCYELQEITGFAEGLVSKTCVFTDSNGRALGRTWEILSYGHARGFALGHAGVEPSTVQILMEAQPLSQADVEMIGMGHLDRLSPKSS